ncbi:BON domain-containing protein [Acaryochloris sp. IP29b_bin.137]|uniref:BON domain-containing protein n=1 Tax=Acaryochloris sp. IP29b_bin.137 TaxID=2969217 RepID=UPI002637A4BD|nr:BON domain-containing protein [Acaryochloris sp. IP29b_bin.137]
MKYAPLALSTLVAVLTIDIAVAQAENIPQPQSESTVLLAGKHKGFRQGNFRHQRQFHPRHFRKFPRHHHFRHRKFRRFPGRFRHRPFHHRRFGRRFYPRFRHYPYIRRRYPRYYPYYYPFSRRLYFNGYSFPRRRSYIAPEHIGPEGKYDHQGLAKRIILGLVADPDLKPLVATLNIQQKGEKVFLSGEVPNQDALDQVIELVKNTKGAKSVDVTEVVVQSESEVEEGDIPSS